MEARLRDDLERVASISTTLTVILISDAGEHELSIRPDQPVHDAVEENCGMHGEIFYAGDLVPVECTFEELGIENGAKLSLHVPSPYEPFRGLTADALHTDESRVDGFLITGGNAGTWNLSTVDGLDGVYVFVTKKPFHHWSRLAIKLPSRVTKPRKLQTLFNIDRLGPNCWYFDLNFALGLSDGSSEGSSDVTATHTIKFDDDRLRTYGCGGFDSSTPCGISSSQWHTLTVEIDWPATENLCCSLRHFVDGSLIFTSTLESLVALYAANWELTSISLGKAAYGRSGATWANIVVE